MIGDMKAGIRGCKIAFAVLVVILAVSCSRMVDDERLPHEDRGEFRQLLEIKPEKPVHIKVKRNASGSYSWELSGNDPDRILEANKKISDTLEVRK
jgi:hypothetical protein